MTLLRSAPVQGSSETLRPTLIEPQRSVLGYGRKHLHTEGSTDPSSGMVIPVEWVGG
jgi:hypothetical protein